LNYSVCIQGFSSFERATFQSLFRLAARRSPSYRCTDEMAKADLVIVDADRPASVDAVVGAGKLPRTLTIGARIVPGSAAGTPRPINMMALLRMLDELTGSDALRMPASAVEAAASTGAVTAGAQRAREPVALRVVPATDAAPSRSLMSVAFMAAPIREAEAPTPGVSAEPDESHILVVDDSDIALRFMRLRLNRLRFQVSMASSGDEALRMLETRRYAFVFLDVMMEGLDGFQTCKRIKRKHYADGVEPPRVIMLTSKGGPIDKLRGTISGCDGYLVKPLNELELVKVIAEFDPGFMARAGESVVA